MSKPQPFSKISVERNLTDPIHPIYLLSTVDEQVDGNAVGEYVWVQFTGKNGIKSGRLRMGVAGNYRELVSLESLARMLVDDARISIKQEVKGTEDKGYNESNLASFMLQWLKQREEKPESLFSLLDGMETEGFVALKDLAMRCFGSHVAKPPRIFTETPGM